MDALFKEILSDNSDPRSKILESLGEIKELCLAKKAFKEESYNRNVICKSGDKNEVVLACWKKDQITSFHHHPNQSCWIYVLKGQLQETLVPYKVKFALKEGLYTWNEFESEYQTHENWNQFKASKKISLISEGTWNYIDDTLGFHRMSAYTDEVVSLHIYRQLEK
jgi:cysteine dioxygenase